MSLEYVSTRDKSNRVSASRAILQGLSQDGRPLFGRVLEQARISVSEDACTLMREVQQGGGHASYMLFGSDLAAGHHAPDFDFDAARARARALWQDAFVMKNDTDRAHPY